MTPAPSHRHVRIYVRGQRFDYRFAFASLAEAARSALGLLSELWPDTQEEALLHGLRVRVGRPCSRRCSEVRELAGGRI